MAHNAVRSMETREHQRPMRALRALPLEKPNMASAETEVVAEILSDGTVRPVVQQEGKAAPKAWSEGSISGRSWILWWTRRSFSQA